MAITLPSGKNTLNAPARWHASAKAWVIMLAPMLLASCARIDQTTFNLTSTHVDAIVVLDTQVLEGTVTLYPDRTGLLTAEGTGKNANGLNCSGNLRYTSSKAGSLRLSCNNGTQAELSYVALTYTSGYARIRQPDRAVSFTFGMSPEEAQGWLYAPAGKRIVTKGSSVAVE